MMKHLKLLIKKFFKNSWTSRPSKSYYNYYSNNQSCYDTYDKKTGEKTPYCIGYNNIQD